MKKTAVIALCAMLFLTSCAASSDNKKESSVDSLISVTQADKADHKERIKSSEYDNISVSKDFEISFPELDSLGIYQVKYTEDFDKNSERLFEKYIAGYNKDYVENIDTDSNTTTIQYDDGKTFSIVTSVGGFVLSEKQYLNKVRYGESVPFITTDLVNAEASAEYTIGTENVSLNDITSACDTFLSDFEQFTAYPNEIKPFAFSTLSTDDGSVAGIMHCRCCYKGLPVFDTKSMYGEYSSGIAMLTPPTFTFIQGKNIMQFASICAFSDVKTVQTIDKIISPAKAVNITSEKLSGYLDYELKYEELVYFPTCNENTSDTEPAKVPEPGDIITLTPYWIIYFDTSWWHETLAAVNAVTGEVDFVNNAR